MSKGNRKEGRFGLISALLWGAVFGGMALIADEGFFKFWAAAAGGGIAGATTASIASWICRLKAGYAVMIPVGLVLGVVVASGTINGIGYALSFCRPDAIQVDLETLKQFAMSPSVLSAAALGAITGAVVRAKIPKQNTLMNSL